jgi:hypothetical protein
MWRPCLLAPFTLASLVGREPDSLVAMLMRLREAPMEVTLRTIGWIVIVMAVLGYLLLPK